MKSFSEREIFSAQELERLDRATEIVRCLPHEIDGWEVRCHELARAVSELLGLSPYGVYVADGYYGMVDHSWIWTSAPSKRPRRWELPNILDVYVPGSLPQVQLVHTATALPLNYRLDAAREDISWKHVRDLVALGKTSTTNIEEAADRRITLHIKEEGPGLGPDIRKCTRCGTRLWLPSDGEYTIDRAAFENPPPDYINCEQRPRGCGTPADSETSLAEQTVLARDRVLSFVKERS